MKKIKPIKHWSLRVNPDGFALYFGDNFMYLYDEADYLDVLSDLVELEHKFLLKQLGYGK